MNSETIEPKKKLMTRVRIKGALRIYHTLLAGPLNRQLSKQFGLVSAEVVTDSGTSIMKYTKKVANPIYPSVPTSH